MVRTRSLASSSRRWMRLRKQAAMPAFVLHGITGSGKTEVYVHLMHHVLQRGGQVLLLVPEINLTPQLENYFRSRFPDVNLVSLHSGLSEGERAAELAAGAVGRGADRAWHAARGVRRVAEACADHRGRGARRLVQAAGRLALFGARRGDLPRQPARRAHRAGLGDAVAGELLQRAERALPDAQADRTRACCRARCLWCAASISARP